MGAVTGRLVERDRELALVAGVLECARAGDGGVLVLSGPAGIGKTVLLDYRDVASLQRTIRATHSFRAHRLGRRSATGATASAARAGAA